ADSRSSFPFMMTDHSITSTEGSSIRTEIFAMIWNIRFHARTLDDFTALFLDIHKLYSTPAYHIHHITCDNMTGSEREIAELHVLTSSWTFDFDDYPRLDRSDNARRVLEGLE
ncbi:hypothetical protein PENTCL1PPCAC_20640, partial [Pristionchus entomophagus]